MKFQIGKGWRIASDDNCWMVQRFRGVYRSGKKAGVVKYANVAYASTLPDAIRTVAQRMLRDLDTDGVDEALAGVRCVADEIEKSLQDLNGFDVKITITMGVDEDDS